MSSIAITFAIVFTLMYQNRVSENENAQFLAEAEENHQKMMQSEQELKGSLEQLQSTQEEEKQRYIKLQACYAYERKKHREKKEESQQLLQEKLRELEAAQRETEDVRQLEKQRAEEQIKSRMATMEKAIAEFEENEAELRQILKLKDEEIKQLSTQG